MRTNERMQSPRGHRQREVHTLLPGFPPRDVKKQRLRGSPCRHNPHQQVEARRGWEGISTSPQQTLKSDAVKIILRGKAELRPQQTNTRKRVTITQLDREDQTEFPT